MYYRIPLSLQFLHYLKKPALIHWRSHLAQPHYHLRQFSGFLQIASQLFWWTAEQALSGARDDGSRRTSSKRSRKVTRFPVTSNAELASVGRESEKVLELKRGVFHSASALLFNEFMKFPQKRPTSFRIVHSLRQNARIAPSALPGTFDARRLTPIPENAWLTITTLAIGRHVSDKITMKFEN